MLLRDITSSTCCKVPTEKWSTPNECIMPRSMY